MEISLSCLPTKCLLSSISSNFDNSSFFYTFYRGSDDLGRQGPVNIKVRTQGTVLECENIIERKTRISIKSVRPSNR